jgi:purine-binding chemotaxis protein CheW
MKTNQNKSGQMDKTRINWDGIKSKVTSLQNAISENGIISSAIKSKTLKERAKVLAGELIDESAGQEYIEIVEFRLGTETYAFETEFVREVYLLNNFTHLPGLPDFIMGIINIRGQILSIVDLKKLFDIPAGGLGELNKIIIIQNEKMEFGILADVVLGTRSILKGSVQESFTGMPGIEAGYLKGVTADHLIILSAKNILEDEKILINQVSEYS